MQPEPLSQQEVQQAEPALDQKVKPPKQKLTIPILIVVLILLCLGGTGLGLLAYNLNTNLSATKQQLATLQADYAELKSNNEKLTADLNKSNADLEKSDGDLVSAQEALKKIQDQNKALKDKIASVSKKTEVLYALANSKTIEDFLIVDDLVKATNDSEVKEQWSEFLSDPTFENSNKFLLVLINSIQKGLK